MNHAKVNLFMERLWLIVGVLGLIYGIYMVNELGFQEAKLYIFYPMIAFALFAMRYGLRKRLEKNQGQGS